MAKLSDYFKKTDETKKLVQVKLNAKLHEETIEKLKSKGLGWSDLLEAACKMLLEEK